MEYRVLNRVQSAESRVANAAFGALRAGRDERPCSSAVDRLPFALQLLSPDPGPNPGPVPYFPNRYPPTASYFRYSAGL